MQKAGQELMIGVNVVIEVKNAGRESDVPVVVDDWQVYETESNAVHKIPGNCLFGNTALGVDKRSKAKATFRQKASSQKSWKAKMDEGRTHPYGEGAVPAPRF